MVPANVDLPVIYRGVAPFKAPQLIGWPSFLNY